MVTDDEWGDFVYVPVAERKRRAAARRKKLEKAGERLEPVQATARGERWAWALVPSRLGAGTADSAA